MSTDHFIFSNRSRYRIMRHVIFWLTWWIIFEFTYFLPYYWYPGWNTHTIPAPLKESGYVSFWLLILSNTMLAVVIQLFFTYTLIYFLQPRYLLKGKYIPFIGSVAILLVVSIVLFYFEFKYGNALIRGFFGRPPKVWGKNELLGCTVDMVLFNCPAVGGAALGIKLLKRWWLKQKESHQLIAARSKAELQLLKAQVHPHFLFNTLNNIYSFILIASPKAPDMIKKLSGLLRYIIYECTQPIVPVEKELKMIQDYMGLEKVRYGDTMDMNIDITGNYKGRMIAPLLLIPFAENSFKHGMSKMLSKSWVHLTINIEDNIFYFMLNNSRPDEYVTPGYMGGIGLSNVKKRLQLLYPGMHKLNITEEPGHFTILLELNMQERKHELITEEPNYKAVYEMV